MEDEEDEEDEDIPLAQRTNKAKKGDEVCYCDGIWSGSENMRPLHVFLHHVQSDRTTGHGEGR